jgi:hypothetical protein
MSDEDPHDNLFESENLTLEIARKLLAAQQRQIQELKEQVEKLQGKNPTPRLDESYSLSAEAKRKQRQQRDADKKKKKAKRKQKKNARMKTADKVKLAARTESYYPTDRTPDDCKFSHDRVAWRLENGKAVLIHYRIYRYRNEFGKPHGLVGRSEFGVEIMVALAYQVYVVGVSIDKACQMLDFFEQLKLRKSQADALLNRLAKAWESEFETLCTLLANSAVVHCDETSWSINSVWAFLNEQLTVLFYGVHKDAQTLKEILDKNRFAGTLVSDNAAVYQGFTSSQKCWAHLIRKAIKLTLEDPDNKSYRQLADDLLLIYRDAKKLAADGRFSDAGRKQRIKDLEDRVADACLPGWTNEKVGGEGHENDYLRLCNEVMRLMIEQELFVFVVRDHVEGTNNASERQLRSDAMARKTGRTSKTPNGARRQSIISSVLQSIGKQLKEFRLQGVIDEIKRWTAVGQSCFEEMRQELEPDKASPKEGILNKVISSQEHQELVAA